jgi:diguanylate cyclase (GGDEF)-like protein
MVSVFLTRTGLRRLKRFNDEFLVAKPNPESPKLRTARLPRVTPQLAAGRSAGPADVRIVPSPGSALAKRLADEVARLAAELAAAKAEIATLSARAERDPLTDVFNRRGFARELERSLAYARRYGTPAALVYLDLDAFKPVNDRYGHAAGDVVLRRVAAALTLSVRGSDVVARLGGDEFAVLMWNISPADARAKAAAMETQIEQATAGLEAMGVGASAGMTMLEAEDLPADVLARADAAMYARKAARRRNN